MSEQQKTQQSAGLSADTDAAAEGIIKNHIIISMTVGLVPAPLFDLAALTATQVSMLSRLSDHYEVAFDDTDIKSLLTSLVSGSIPVLGVLGLSSTVKLIPGIGTLVGSASVSILAGTVTYAVGRVFAAHFKAGGTLEDFDPKQARAFFKSEFAAGKQYVKDLRAEVKVAMHGEPAEAAE